MVDTGAAETIILPEVLDELGYSPRQGEAITVLRSAVGREEGYMIRVVRFACLGFHLKDFRVHAHDLPEGFDIDGLIGLSFLKQFDYAMRAWPELRRGRYLDMHVGAKGMALMLKALLDGAHAGRLKTWDLRWWLALWQRDALSIAPNRNLVTNILSSGYTSTRASLRRGETPPPPQTVY